MAKEYIEREALKDNMRFKKGTVLIKRRGWFRSWRRGFGVFVRFDVVDNAIENTPAADVVEVRHGYWIYFRDDGIKRCKCSECWTSYGCMDTPFCPNCGAKMDMASEEE